VTSYGQCYGELAVGAPGADLRQKAISATLPERPHLPSFILPPLPSRLIPSPPLTQKLAPQIQLGGLGSAVSSPSGVWGGAAAEIEFGVF